MRMTEMTAVELSAAIRAGQVTAVEAVEEMLAGIEERDALYNCYVTVDREPPRFGRVEAVYGFLS